MARGEEKEQNNKSTLPFSYKRATTPLIVFPVRLATPGGPV